MADTLAIFVLAMQYLLVVLAVKHFWPTLPLAIAVGVFIIVAIAGIVYWHKKKSQEVREWRKLIVFSIVVGGILLNLLDVVLLRLDIGGGILSFPLNFAICPIFTIICVAGLVRSLYIGRAQTNRAQSSQA
jgi:hypothetical protein